MGRRRSHPAVLDIRRDTGQIRHVDKQRALAEELARKDKAFEALCHSVSHDLRAPLRTIDGFSQALLEDCADKLDATGREYLDRVRAAAQRMAAMIDGLLQLSRVSQAELLRVRTNLSEIARSVADELQRKEPARRVALSIEDDRFAMADGRLMKVVLSHLLANAWKFTARTGAPRIEFGATEKDGATAFFVRDNGAGFDMAYVGKLFSPFRRLHGEAEFPGIGIGLATVQRILDRHGGRVWAEGAVGRGATIRFTLPDERIEGEPREVEV